jgi:hypothetical protein
MAPGADDVNGHKARLALGLIEQGRGVDAVMFAKWMVHHLD